MKFVAIYVLQLNIVYFVANFVLVRKINIQT
jgi:hypothetical protein